MSRISKNRPGNAGRRYPGRQYTLSDPVTPRHAKKPYSPGKSYRIFLIPSPADFYAAEIDGFQEGNNGWASGYCPFHDDHHPSFAMHLESGGFKCLASHCGASGGSIVSFVCLLHGMSPIEARRYLESRS